MRRVLPLMVAIAGVAFFAIPACGLKAKMNFFVTSVGVGDGGNLGGLRGADAHCQTLAAAAGSPKHGWRAYLSASGEDARPINARDRIGSGPWFNAKGVQIASNVDALHGSDNKLGGTTSLDERGDLISSSAHDILTGSNADGTLADGDTTCHNWTSSAGGQAMVGHSNKVGNFGTRVRSWNSAHVSAGCSLPDLQKLGGKGLLYCFATD